MPERKYGVSVDGQPLGLDISRDGVLTDPSVRAVYGVPDSAVTPYRSKDGAAIELAVVTTAWIEQELSGPWDGWAMASRVVADDRGLPAIAEVRVFPSESGRPETMPAGTWSGTILARPRVPKGGIHATLLRRGLPLRDHDRIASSALDMIGLSHARASAGHRMFDAARSTLREMGFALEPSAPVRQKFARNAGRRPGRPRRWDDADLARVALTYDDAIRRGEPATEAVRKEMRTSLKNATNLIARARSGGKLLPARRQGRTGPLLPKTARAELRKQANRSIRH